MITLDGSADLAGALQRHLTKDLDQERRRIATAYTDAARDVLNAYVGELKTDVRSTGFRNASKLANTWRGRVYNDDGLSPAIYIWNRARVIIDAFSLGMTITAVGRKYLAIPVGAAVPIVRALNATENRSRDSFGRFASENSKVMRVAAALGVRLNFIPPRGDRPGELVTPDHQVVFILVRSVTPPQRMMGRALLRSFQVRFGPDMAAAIARHL